LLGIFIASPWLALLPAALFLALYRLSRRRVAALAGVAWLAYACYEYSIHRRWLCSGECDIRADLLLLYPLLALVSAAAIVAALLALARHRAARSGEP